MTCFDYTPNVNIVKRVEYSEDMIVDFSVLKPHTGEYIVLYSKLRVKFSDDLITRCSYEILYK